MPKSIEDIDRQIAALKEQKKRQQAQIAQKKREGLRSCKELIGEEVVNAFDNWTSIDLDLFAMYISEHADEIVTSCSTSETDLDDALKRNKQFAKTHKKTNPSRIAIRLNRTIHKLIPMRCPTAPIDPLPCSLIDRF